MRLKDKVAIVTGGAKGIGRHYSLALAADGHAPRQIAAAVGYRSVQALRGRTGKMVGSVAEA